MQIFLPQPSSSDRYSLGLGAVLPSVIPVSHGRLLGDMQQHGLLQADLGSVDITVRNCSALGGRQFSPLPMPPSFQACAVPRAVDFVRSTVPLYPSALFSIVQQLWFCVFGFTTQQKRACCHLRSCGGLYDQTTQTSEFGSKIILVPLGDYC